MHSHEFLLVTFEFENYLTPDMSLAMLLLSSRALHNFPDFESSRGRGRWAWPVFFLPRCVCM